MPTSLFWKEQTSENSVIEILNKVTKIGILLQSRDTTEIFNIYVIAIILHLNYSREHMQNIEKPINLKQNFLIYYWVIIQTSINNSSLKIIIFLLLINFYEIYLFSTCE